MRTEPTEKRIGKRDVTRYPIDIDVPCLKPFRQGTDGVDYVHVLKGDRPGPTVMINALVHGNEVCGAIVVKTLLERELRPRRGQLILSFANVAAYEAFDPTDPDRTRFIDEDFNRVWSEQRLNGSGTSAELQRARALRPFVDTADYLLDLHSMHETCKPLMVCGPLEKNVDFARRLGTPACLIRDQGHAEGTRMRDYGDFGDPSSPRAAVLIECGQHWERSAVAAAFDATARFLSVTGTADAADLEPTWFLPSPTHHDLVTVSEAVATQSGHFEFRKNWTGLETLAAGEIIGWENDQAVAAPYDDCVLVMPSLRHARAGVTVVRLGRREANIAG